MKGSKNQNTGEFLSKIGPGTGEDERLEEEDDDAAELEEDDEENEEINIEDEAGL
jgi:hypothetical protein